MHRLADRLTPAPQCTSTPVTPCDCVKLLLVMTSPVRVLHQGVAVSLAGVENAP